MNDTAIDTKLWMLFDEQVKEIIAGNAPLPNMAPVTTDVGAAILHYRTMHCGVARMPDTADKQWGARFFLDYGQGGQFYGSGVVAWTVWKNGAYRAVAMKFAICVHKPVEGASANHSRGWHPARCVKCGLDMSIDSGD